MTFPNGVPMGEAIGSVIRGARRVRGAEPEGGQIDKILAAATLVGLAVVIAWPKDKPVPGFARKVGDVGRQVWERRSWWLS